jgi:hypothetical protein
MLEMAASLPSHDKGDTGLTHSQYSPFLSVLYLSWFCLILSRLILSHVVLSCLSLPVSVVCPRPRPNPNPNPNPTPNPSVNPTLTPNPKPNRKP